MGDEHDRVHYMKISCLNTYTISYIHENMVPKCHISVQSNPCIYHLKIHHTA